MATSSYILVVWALLASVIYALPINESNLETMSSVLVATPIYKIYPTLPLNKSPLGPSFNGVVFALGKSGCTAADYYGTVHHSTLLDSFKAHRDANYKPFHKIPAIAAVLVTEGECSFSEQGAVAASIGYGAIIISSSKPALASLRDQSVPNALNVPIPALLVSRSSGAALYAASKQLEASGGYLEVTLGYTNEASWPTMAKPFARMWTQLKQQSVPTLLAIIGSLLIVLLYVFEFLYGVFLFLNSVMCATKYSRAVESRIAPALTLSADKASYYKGECCVKCPKQFSSDKLHCSHVFDKGSIDSRVISEMTTCPMCERGIVNA